MLPVVLPDPGLRAPTVRSTLGTTATLLAFTAAWLLTSQFAYSRRSRDRWLAGAAWTLALVNLTAHALPAALDVRAGTQSATVDLCGNLIAGGMFAAAAFGSPERMAAGKRSMPSAVALGLVAVVGCELAGLALAGQAAGSRIPGTALRAVGHPLGVVLTLAASVTLASVAVAFLSRRRLSEHGSGLLVAVAAMLLAQSSLYHLLELSSVQTVGIAGMRAIAFALLLAAGVRHELSARARVAKAAALAERRRVASDLHDGLAQDLAFIAAHGSALAKDMGDDHPVVTAARRALAISRGAISELSQPSGVSAQESLEAVAHELRERFNIAIAVDTRLNEDLPSHEREHVARIVREAIANAVRHGGARSVSVSLGHDGGAVALRVRDDGCGLTAKGGGQAPEGFGLRSMRERASGLGGALTVHEPDNGGTELELVLP